MRLYFYEEQRLQASFVLNKEMKVEIKRHIYLRFCLYVSDLSSVFCQHSPSVRFFQLSIARCLPLKCRCLLFTVTCSNKMIEKEEISEKFCAEGSSTSFHSLFDYGFSLTLIKQILHLIKIMTQMKRTKGKKIGEDLRWNSISVPSA